MPDRSNPTRRNAFPPTASAPSSRHSQSHRDALRRVVSMPFKPTPARAMTSSLANCFAKPLPSVRPAARHSRHPQPSSNFIFIRNLNHNIAVDSLHRILDKQEPAAIRHVLVPEISGRRQGIASVQLSISADASSIAYRLHGTSILGQSIAAYPDPSARLYHSALKEKRFMADKSHPVLPRNATNAASQQSHAASQTPSPPKRTRPSQNASNNTGPALFVGNLPHYATGHDLLHHFRQFRPENIAPRTTNSRWIIFANDRDRDDAYRSVSRVFNGRHLTVTLPVAMPQRAQSASQKPPTSSNFVSSPKPASSRSYAPSSKTAPQRTQVTLSKTSPLRNQPPPVTSRQSSSSSFRTSNYAPRADASYRSEYAAKSNFRSSSSYLPPRSGFSSRSSTQYRPEIDRRAKYTRPAPHPVRNERRETTWTNPPVSSQRSFRNDTRSASFENRPSSSFVSGEKHASTRACAQVSGMSAGKDDPENEQIGLHARRKSQSLRGEEKNNSHTDSRAREKGSNSVEQNVAAKMDASKTTFTEEELQDFTYGIVVSRIKEHLSTRRMLKLEAALTNTFTDFLKKLEDAEREQKAEAEKALATEVPGRGPQEASLPVRGESSIAIEGTAKSDRQEGRGVTPAHSDLFHFLFEDGASIPRRGGTAPQRKRNRTSTTAGGNESESTACNDTDKGSQGTSADSEQPRKRSRKSRFADAAHVEKSRRDVQEEVAGKLQREHSPGDHSAEKADEIFIPSKREDRVVDGNVAHGNVCSGEKPLEKVGNQLSSDKSIKKRFHEDKDERTCVSRAEKEKYCPCDEGMPNQHRKENGKMDVSMKSELQGDIHEKDEKLVYENKNETTDTSMDKDTDPEENSVESKEEENTSTEEIESKDAKEREHNRKELNELLECEDRSLEIAKKSESFLDRPQEAVEDNSTRSEEKVLRKEHESQKKTIRKKFENSVTSKAPHSCKDEKQENGASETSRQKVTEKNDAEGNGFITLADLKVGARLLRSHMKEIMRESGPEQPRNQEETKRSKGGKAQICEGSRVDDSTLNVSKKRSAEIKEEGVLDVPKAGKGKRRKIGRRGSYVTAAEASETIGDETSLEVKESASSGVESCEVDEALSETKKASASVIERNDGESARTKGIDLSEWRSKKRERPREYVQQNVDVVTSSRDNRQRNRILRKGISLINPKHDILTMNSLKQRKKAVQYRKSEIHGMGLFACERIEPQEFVLEYIGQIVRSVVAEMREAAYTRRGMGDSYLFRLSNGMVVDATHTGGIARFINHSCDPNVIAKIIPVDGHPKIVFYSRRVIKVDEELTYDYKFEFEDDDKKIPCLCKATNCRKYLN